MRIANDFEISWSLNKALYCDFVRPLLEYGSILRDTNTAYLSCQLERVQKKILNFVGYTLNVECLPHDYSSVLVHLNMKSLADQRRIANLVFLNKLSVG